MGWASQESIQSLAAGDAALAAVRRARVDRTGLVLRSMIFRGLVFAAVTAMVVWGMADEGTLRDLDSGLADVRAEARRYLAEYALFVGLIAAWAIMPLVRTWQAVPRRVVTPRRFTAVPSVISMLASGWWAVVLWGVTSIAYTETRGLVEVPLVVDAIGVGSALTLLVSHVLYLRRRLVLRIEHDALHVTARGGLPPQPGQAGAVLSGDLTRFGRPTAIGVVLMILLGISSSGAAQWWLIPIGCIVASIVLVVMSFQTVTAHRLSWGSIRFIAGDAGRAPIVVSGDSAIPLLPLLRWSSANEHLPWTIAACADRRDNRPGSTELAHILSSHGPRTSPADRDEVIDSRRLPWPWRDRPAVRVTSGVFRTGSLWRRRATARDQIAHVVALSVATAPGTQQIALIIGDDGWCRARIPLSGERLAEVERVAAALGLELESAEDTVTLGELHLFVPGSVRWHERPRWVAAATVLIIAATIGVVVLLHTHRLPSV